VQGGNRLSRANTRRRAARGERLGGYIYGTIVVLATVVAGAKAYGEQVGHVALLVLITTVVFWLAHVYAHALALSVAEDQHLSRSALTGIARRESSIIEAALAPIGALLLGHWGIVSERTAVWLAVGCGLGALVAQGFAFARAERLGRLATLAIVAVNLGLGVVLVGLKLWVNQGHQ
jgi:hypothetical protein